MPSLAFRRVEIALAVGVLGIASAACGQPASEAKPHPNPIGTRSKPLPAVVEGVPLLDLAKRALGAAKTYGVAAPVNVQVVVTTQAALYAQVPIAGGSTGPEYVVVLQGRFSGATETSPATAVPMSTTTIDASSVRFSTMMLELPLPLTNGTTGIAVGVAMPNMAELGHVYHLDPYVKSLAGIAVPLGPLPG